MGNRKVTKRVRESRRRTTHDEKNKIKGSATLVPCHPVGAPRDKLDRIVDGPEHALGSAPIAPALLVAQYHSLRGKVSSSSRYIISCSHAVRQGSVDREQTTRRFRLAPLTKSGGPAR